MSKLTLKRYCYSETEVEGWLWIDDGHTRLHTIERPWKPGAPGGLPYVSCIPEGVYSCSPYVRSDKSVVPRLYAPDLDVWHTAEERPNGKGRYAVLIHSGNTVDDSSGCCIPGFDRIIHRGRPFVTNSRKAMEMIMLSRPTEIEIVCACGTD